MGKGKKRPWIQAKLAAADADGAGGGGGEATRHAEIARERKRQKAADRAARERAFRERHPERFEATEHGDDPSAGVGGAPPDPASRGDDDPSASRWGWSDGSGGGAGGGYGGVDPDPDLPSEPRRGKPRSGGPPRRPPVDDECVDPSTLPDVKPWMRSKEASLPPDEKERRWPRAEVITRLIASAAQHKQLGKAVAHYRQLVTRERLIPTSYTYASLINAYVNSGHMPGASEVLRRMRAVPGMAPNVVVYTTLLKGHMLAGDVDAAEALMRQMPRQKPPYPWTRARVNTFLRTCQRAGDTPRAWDAWRKTRDGGEWSAATADDATYKLIARLLAQALRVGDLRGVIDAAKRDAAAAKAAGPGGGGPSAPPCQFWNGGCCDRGSNCQFYHDPEVTQRADIERLDAAAGMHVNLAHAAALLNDEDVTRSAIEAANEALDAVENNLQNRKDRRRRPGDSSATYKRTTRAELRLELRRVGGFLKRVRKGMQERPDLVEYLSRALVFSSRVESESGSGTAPEPEGDKEGSRGSSDDPEQLADALLGRLRDAFGLEPACVASGANPSSVRARLRESVAEDGTVDFAGLFRHPPPASDADAAEGAKTPERKEKKSKKEKKKSKDKEKEKDGDSNGRRGGGSRAVKLEICAGNGDWAVAQAKADPDSDWVALELRHDRVYSIFSRAVLEGASNLCAMGGDAARVVRRNLRAGSVSHVFVNFPEPPHHSGNEAADNRHHLLTPSFFKRVHAALEPGGGLTLFSDNHRYMQTLAKTLAELLHEEGDDAADAEKIGEPMFSAEAAEGTSMDGSGKATHENVAGVRLYRGLPGKGTGHAVYEQSYFDRFWEQGAHTDRFFMVLSKN